jgi:hypothetical protein
MAGGACFGAGWILSENFGESRVTPIFSSELDVKLPFRGDSVRSEAAGGRLSARTVSVSVEEVSFESFDFSEKIEDAKLDPNTALKYEEASLLEDVSSKNDSKRSLEELIPASCVVSLADSF